MDILTSDEQNYFKNWLELNLLSISWEGRYLNEFNHFWDDLFPVDIPISDQFTSLYELKKTATEGPLVSWFNWITEKLICFVFLHKNLSIKEIANYSDMREAEISFTLRNFFIERYPHLEDQMNKEFHFGNKLSKTNQLKFTDIKNKYHFDKEIRGRIEDDILASLEITLYSEWNKLKNLISKTATTTKSDTKKKISVRSKFKFIRELLILFLIGGILIFAVKYGNKWYESYLVKKISLFEPNFFWLDKNLSFKTDTILKNDKIDIKSNELERLEEIESKKVFQDTASTSRYGVESDVVLTSVDSLPKNFADISFEQSEYEEIKKGGYRNMRYGRRKAYRIMMTSVSPKEAKRKIISYLDKYKIKQVDNVKPGTEIPGGLYFNLYVPIEYLKEFIEEVSVVEESIILESKTVRGGPAGTSKVFIWVKTI